MIVNFIHPYNKNVLIPATETTPEKWKAIYSYQKDLTFQDLITAVKNPSPIEEKHKAIAWNFDILEPYYTYPDPKFNMALKIARIKQNTVGHSLITLDCDKNVDMKLFIEKQFKFKYIIHSTATCKQDFKKYRILIPLANPIKYDDFIVPILLDYFKFMNLDKTCLQDARLFYCPATLPETYYEYHIQEEGNLFNPLMQFAGMIKILEQEHRDRELKKRMMEKMRPETNLVGALKWSIKKLEEFVHLPSDSGHEIHNQLVNILSWYKKKGGNPDDLVRYCRDHQEEAQNISDSFR